MTRKLFAALLIALTPALANSPEPGDQDIARAAQTCTAQGAFGHRFGDRGTDAEGKETPIVPFRIETLSARGDGLFEITALAWFGKAPMSGEDRLALANWFFGKLDAEIAASRKFAAREPRRDGVAYRFAVPGSEGFVLDLSRDGVNVRLACTDITLKRRAREVMREGQ